ncbi:hypothetical protein D7Y22_02375 [Stenotrophomonas maltophilia]|uniref:hypothetical protein n=1 Tax=Stenotrophomonas maltophilia TaxID=40324 RepID=UPI0015DE256E|nr:hypothetical protein [Stenotrophomonas maltophilia]MBA0419807.1 hypothetical protein [Stenotrophomonas maltophilia]
MNEQSELLAALRAQTEATHQLVAALREKTKADVDNARAVNRLVDYLCDSEGGDAEPAGSGNYLSGKPR